MTGRRNWLCCEIKLLQLLVRCSLLGFPVFPLELTLNSNDLKCADFTRLDGFVTDKFEEVSRVSAEILPREDFLAVIPDLGPEM